MTAVRHLSVLSEARPPGFGGQLELLRLRHGSSQSELARRAGIDPAYVNRLERGTGTPSRGVVTAIWAALGASLGDRERLLVAAGLCPETIIEAGGWDPYLADCDAAVLRAIDGNVAVLARKLELLTAALRRQATLIRALRSELGGELVRVP